MSELAYDAIAIAIFAFVAINFLFPCNVLIPLGKSASQIQITMTNLYTWNL